MEKNQDEKQSIGTSIQKMIRYSTIILSLFLLAYYCVTVFGVYHLNNQITLLTEHPFVVSRHVGKIQTNISVMKGQAEELQFSHESEEIESVRQDFLTWHEQVEGLINDVVYLYLGPPADAALIYNGYQTLKTEQEVFLAYVTAPGRTSEEIIQYEKKHLYPIYQKIEEGISLILAYTHNTQMTVYHASNSLWTTIFFCSTIIITLTIAGLLIFRYSLGKMNKDLYDKNQQFDTLSKTIDETFLIFERENNECDFVAESSGRILGIEADVLRKDRTIIYRWVDQSTKVQMKEKIFNSPMESGQELSIRYTHPKTKENRWLLARFYWTDGAADHAKHIMTFSDQTEDMLTRQALQDALQNARNANNAKRDFLSRMSHEIRTPMNAIIGMTTIAGASITDRKKVEDCLLKIGYSSKHLLMLINDVLDMSRIESNKLLLSNEPFDLYQFVNALMAISYPQAQNKGIILTERIVGFGESTTYSGDAMRLNQILLNLLSNAIKFTNNGGKVDLEIKRLPSKEKNERIRFSVSDTGIGMDEDAVKRIYSPFEQANTGIAQTYGGTGLGMSITKNLVSLMGGFIDVKSVPNEGTVCTVELAFEKSHVELEMLPVDDLKALHVLVVDDEKDMCEHTVFLLAKINIRTDWALSGQEAIDKVVQAQDIGDGFDICFIDWQMPEMDGVETTRRIREKVSADTPIIIISTYDWSEIEAEARSAGANAFIAKPSFMSSMYNILVNVTNGAFARSVSHEKAEINYLSGKKILVAEDNELNLEIVEELLKMNGAEVEGVENGQKALDQFIASEPGYFDAILMDIQMPILNGYEATEQLRALKRPDAKTIPIIATTGNAFTEDIVATIAVGMNAHVSKPIDMDTLCKVLTQLI